MDKLLVYESVDISYNGETAVRDISFSLAEGEILGIVGESGSGKSTIIRAALGILEKNGTVTRGNIRFRGRNLIDLSEREMRSVRGRQMGMIFQNSGASFCPIRTIGDQIHESLSAHGKTERAVSDRKALELFERLGLKDGKRILESYPFEMSGGMNQRIGIAVSMLMEPSVLLADEPTSALDVTVQRQVVEEMLMMRKIYGTAIVLVTHNIAVVRAMADTVLVLKNGKIVEYGEAERIWNHPRASYTKELLDAVPVLRRD